MPKIDSQILKQFWQITKLYWLSPQQKKARYLLLLLIILSVFSSSFLIWETLQRGEIISSLAVRDGARFWQSIKVLSFIIIITIPLSSFKLYIESKLGLNWRKWLTETILDKYLNNRKFYYLNSYSHIDNPDQRIAEDIKNFSQQSLFLFTLTLDSLIQLIAFVGILWLIYQPLVLLLVIYSTLGTTLLVFLFAKALTIINFEQIKKEADFRFTLIRTRDNAESIAFYQGEKIEYHQVRQKLRAALNNFSRLIRWQFGLDIFQNGFQFITIIIPALILAPSILAGQIEVGTITQSQIAFERIWLSLSLAIFQLEKLTTLAAEVRRLASLIDYLKAKSNIELSQESVIRSRHTDIINIKENNQLSFVNLSLATPNLETKLINNLSLSISKGQRLLIVGNSGVGKSSLVKAIAGLWQSGTGLIIKPEKKDILFLPQRPYLILGSLQDQILYPNFKQEIEDNFQQRNFINTKHEFDLEKLWELVEQVNLTEVVKKNGGLTIEKNWSQILSRGEQQRLAFARLLLHQPKYVILDEATSALDDYNQDLLYRQLEATKITFISIGHRSNLLQYHQQVLQLTEEKSWYLLPAKDFSFS